MMADKKIEHVGITITISPVYAGYEYEFDYKGKRYFAHYPFDFMAESGAKDRIDRLILGWGE